MNNEKTFADVVSDIKMGEVWKTDNTKIYLTNEGALIIKHENYLKNIDINQLTTEITAINLKSKYTLELSED